MKKILLIEDDTILCKSINFFLTGKGYQVETAENGKIAIEKLEQSNFDLIITDLNLPYITGFEVIQYLRSILHASTPIIVLTAHGIESVELESFELGASEFISKPFSPAVLHARVSKLVAA